jgi:Cu+-exporting ATPase
VTGTIEGRKVALGNAAMMQADGIDVAGLEAAGNEMRNEGATAIFAAVDGKAIGVIAVADPVNPTTAVAVGALRDAGVRVVMLTGDNRKTAEAVAQKLGIDEIEAEILP